MSTPSYKGLGQPTPSATSGITGWLGGFLGGGVTPAYKTTPTAVPTVSPPTAAPCAPCAGAAKLPPVGQSADAGACVPLPLPFGLDTGDAVIPVGPGPITIVIQPRS